MQGTRPKRSIVVGETSTLPFAVRATVPAAGSVADTATVPNNANACGADNDKLVLTSTGFTGPLLNENDPDTYTKSETRNNTLSADAPTTGCSNNNALNAPAVEVCTR